MVCNRVKGQLEKLYKKNKLFFLSYFWGTRGNPLARATPGAPWGPRQTSRVSEGADPPREVKKTFLAFSDGINRVPSAHSFMLTSFMFGEESPKEIVVVSKEKDAEAISMVRKIQRFQLMRIVTPIQ